MRKFIKINSLLLLLVFVLQILPQNVFGAYEAENTDSYQTDDILEKLSALNIDISEYNSDKFITRGEAARVIISLIGERGEKATGDIFGDVSCELENAGAIEKLHSLGLVFGFSDGNFYPNSDILPAQAVKILVSILGYDMDANSNGGYPNGYMTVAYSKKMLKFSIDSANQGITWDEFVMLINNSLDINLIEYSYATNINKYGGTNEFKESDETILSKYLNASYTKGRIMGNTITTLYSKIQVGSGTININDLKLDAEKYDVDRYLGYEVELYYTNKKHSDGENVVLYAHPTKNNSVEIVQSENVIFGDRDTVEYERESSGKSKRISIKNNVVIVNGIFSTNYTDETFNADRAQYTFLDYNNDGENDVVFVDVFESHIVEYATEDSIKFLFDEGSIEADKVDRLRVIRNDSEIELKNIEGWETVTVLKSENNEYCRIYASNVPENGAITQIKNDDDKTEIISGDKSYKVSSKYYQRENAVTLKVGGEYRFYVDMFGYIVYAKQNIAISTADGNCKYGYLSKVTLNTDNDTIYYFKILAYNAEGVSEYKVYEGDEKIKIDEKLITDIKQTKLWDSERGAFKPQLIKFKIDVNTGLVKTVETAMDRFHAYTDWYYSGANEEFLDGDGNGIPMYDDPGEIPALPNKTVNPERIQPWYDGYDLGNFSVDFCMNNRPYISGSFDGPKYFIDFQTMVFVVNSGDDAQDDDFYVTNSYFRNLKYYTATFYDVREDYTVSVAVIDTGLGTQSSTSEITQGEMILVNKIHSAVNPITDDITYKLEGYKGSEPYEGYLWSTNIKDADTGILLCDVPEGTIIRADFNSSENIVRMEIVYLPSDNAEFFELLSNGSAPSISDNYAEKYWALGKVIKATSSALFVNAHEDGTDPNWIRGFLKPSTVLVYDFDNNTISPGEASDFRTGDIVFVEKSHRYAPFVVIYRKK